MRFVSSILSCCITLIIVLNIIPVVDVYAEEIEVSAISAIVIEASTGSVIYEKNADEQLAPASVTKVMTLLLIFEALEEEKIYLTDIVTVSEYASSMGGSQIYLEAGEEQTVETMMKSITVASANDACVAMAEFVEGSENEFVAKMNDKAQELGMTNTNFVNCNGLDAEGHVTTARDIATMSNELIMKYPEVEEYTMIWMEDITHVTAKGSSIFGLSNTNKLIKEYAYTTGLKTGSTDNAKFCISATARKDEIDMIAVVMGAPTSNDRTSDAIALLDYGFSKSQKYIDEEQLIYNDIVINKGIRDTVEGIGEEKFAYIDTNGNDLSLIEKDVEYLDAELLTAPIFAGDTVGNVYYRLNGEIIGSVELKALDSVEAMSLKYTLFELLPEFLL
ncbi:MAG: D-alanyl-D-alanine carboxypeptidase family protein [Eubacteriales bacterium]